MKILNAEQIRAADAFSIAKEPIASIDLMERASQACVKWITEKYNSHSFFHIFCGKGNNGGDGLAIARLLHETGSQVKCHIVHFTEFGSEDFNINKERLVQNGMEWNDIHKAEEIPLIKINEVLIDAIFGSGLNRPSEGIVSELINAMNHSGNETLSIDMPSGLFCEDNSSNDHENIMKATHTLTFQLPKLALLLPENVSNVGEWHSLDIGLDPRFIEEQETKYFYTTREDISEKILDRGKFSHKGNHGHVLLISGMKGKMGASILSARACFRSGVGLLTIHCPKCGYEILQESVPEAMVELNEGQDHLEGVCTIKERTVAVGPGIGTENETFLFFEQLLEQCEIPMVIDADAINIISKKKDLLSMVPNNSIFTPHPGEFRRLVGKFDNDTEKLEMLREFCSKHKCYMVLKGAHTVICTPDGKIHFNSTGNPGMATGGSGDVLTGIVAGLLAQGYPPQDAAIVGVYLHGSAGNLAANETSERSMIASDIVDHISKAYQILEKT